MAQHGSRRGHRACRPQRNGNGRWDDGEPPIEGVEITLSWTGGTDTTTTNERGEYWFTWLEPGITYTVTETPPSGSAQTTPDPPPLMIFSGQEYVATPKQAAAVLNEVTFPWWWEIVIDPVGPADPAGQGDPVQVMVEGMATFGFSDLVDMETGEVVPLVNADTGEAKPVPQGRSYVIDLELIAMDLSGEAPPGLTGGQESGQVRVRSLGGGGQLVVSNIGSSGEDGVRGFD